MITVTDLFAGAGGSSSGMVSVPGVDVRMAANHWAMASGVLIEVLSGASKPLRGVAEHAEPGIAPGTQDPAELSADVVMVHGGQPDAPTPGDRLLGAADLASVPSEAGGLPAQRFIPVVGRSSALRQALPARRPVTEGSLRATVGVGVVEFGPTLPTVRSCWSGHTPSLPVRMTGQAGNAVTPPAARDLVAAVVEALAGAA